jgi:hypothetical protein
MFRRYTNQPLPRTPALAQPPLDFSRQARQHPQHRFPQRQQRRNHQLLSAPFEDCRFSNHVKPIVRLAFFRQQFAVKTPKLFKYRHTKCAPEEIPIGLRQYPMPNSRERNYRIFVWLRYRGKPAELLNGRSQNIDFLRQRQRVPQREYSKHRGALVEKCPRIVVEPKRLNMRQQIQRCGQRLANFAEPPTIELCAPRSFE